MRLLVIEDEKKTAAFLVKGLREAGFVVDLAHDGEAGLKVARTAKFDLLVVDVMLPKKDGWEVVTDLRRDGIRTPILFLTARDSVRDRVKGLELGADDYLIKPFAFSELLARVTADENGNYRVALPPGNYVLDMGGQARERLRWKAQTFTVVSNRTVRVDMVIDTDHWRVGSPQFFRPGSQIGPTSPECDFR